MFSYTDDAIVTSSPTGHHLSTVIRRPAAIGPLDWNEHADQVCKVLNELDRNAKLNYQVSYSLGAGFQTVGRVKRDQPATEARQPMPSANPEREENVFLRRKLDDATTKLCAAQMLLEKPIEVGAQMASYLYYLPKGSTALFNNRTFKRVE